MIVILRLFVSLFTLMSWLLIEPALAYSDRIETCSASLFLKGDTGHLSYHGNSFFDERDLINSKIHDGVKEEVLLFDWDELLRDISPVLEKCISIGGKPFCNISR